MHTTYIPPVTAQVTVLQSNCQPLFEVPLHRAAVVFVFLVLLAPTLHAQNASLGGSYTLLSLTYPDQIPNGFGGWFSWDFNESGLTVGTDIGVNFFPEDHPVIGRQTQLFGGVRARIRNRAFGAFARLRPGAIHFSERFFGPDTVCILIFPPPESCLIRATNLAVDLGGTIEVYPPGRSLLRFDVGTAMIRFSRDGQDAIWKNNLQFSAGAGIRF